AIRASFISLHAVSASRNSRDLHRAADSLHKITLEIMRVRIFAAVLAAALYAQTAPQTQTSSILDYIKQTWGVLTRSNKDLAKAAVDPKFHPEPDGRWPVYVPQNGDVRSIEQQLQRDMSAAALK